MCSSCCPTRRPFDSPFTSFLACCTHITFHGVTEKAKPADGLATARPEAHSPSSRSPTITAFVCSLFQLFRLMEPSLQQFDPLSAERAFFDICRTNNSASLTELNAQFGACANSFLQAKVLAPEVAKVYSKTAAKILTVASSISAAHRELEELVRNFDKRISINPTEAPNSYVQGLGTSSSSEDDPPRRTSKLLFSSLHGSAASFSNVGLTADESHCVMKTWSLR